MSNHSHIEHKYNKHKHKHRHNKNKKHKLQEYTDDSINFNTSTKFDYLKNNQDVDTYIRKKLLMGIDNISTNTQYDNLTSYQNDHFNFRNNVWQSSNDVDQVDKLNELYIKNDQNLNKSMLNNKISDIFNSLTANGKQPDFPTNKMNEWKYENENISNGGIFYNNISAFDPSKL